MDKALNNWSLSVVFLHPIHGIFNTSFMLLQVKHHNVILDKNSKFVIETDVQQSYLRYRIYDQTIELYSAYVPENLRGNGYAAALILFALQYAVLNGLWVKASCAAVKAYINHYPEWRYIIAKD